MLLLDYLGDGCAWNFYKYFKIFSNPSNLVEWSRSISSEEFTQKKNKEFVYLAKFDNYRVPN